MWIDIETTGLNLKSDRILEVACVPTDADLNQLDEGFSVVLAFKRQDWLEDDYVRKMHTENGLLAECADHGVWAFEAQKLLRRYVNKFGAANTVPMCGSTIAFDRKFCERYLEDFESWFFYRSIDVSTVKQLWKLWFPNEEEAPKPEVKAHRAMGDVLESIEELKYYRNWFAKWYNESRVGPLT